MLSPAKLAQVAVEMIFVLLGILVVWLGLNGSIYFDRRSVSWLIIGLAVAAWGLIGLTRPGGWWARWQKWNRGGSLILLGLLMLAITRVPFLWVGKLLVACGVVLLLRGITGSVLILRQR